MLNKILKFNFLEIFIAIFILSSFFTDLRFANYPIGISELMFFPLFFYSLYCFILKKNFELTVPIEHLLLVATILSLLFVTSISSTLNSTNTNLKSYNLLHNLLSVIYINLIIFIIIILKPNYFRVGIFLIYFGFIITLFFFIFSFFHNDFFSMQLFYSNTEKISLFTKNHHQIGFFSSILLLLSSKNLFEQKKIIYIFPIILFIAILYFSQSNGNIAALILSFLFASIIFILLRYFNLQIFISICIIFFILLFISFWFIINNEQFTIFFYNNFYKPLSIISRLEIVANYFEKLNIFDILIGSGAGNYSLTSYNDNSLRELHYTNLDIFMYSGIIPTILMISLYLQSFNLSVRKNLFIITTMIFFIMIYSTTHNILRYPFFWIFFLFINSLSFYNLKNEN